MSSATISNEKNNSQTDNANPVLSDETVANFLTNNPDFFHRNPTILSVMKKIIRKLTMLTQYCQTKRLLIF